MKTLILNVNGMACDSCAEHLRQSLNLIKGVHQVEIDLMSRTTRVRHDETLCRPSDIIRGVERVGYQVDHLAAEESEVSALLLGSATPTAV